jgi:hypothetical protein
VGPTPGADRWPFTLEKWYVDTLLPDGSVLIVYLGRMRLWGVSTARLAAALFQPGEPPREGGAGARDLVCRDGVVQLGAAQLSERSLHWETAGLSGHLEFTPRYPAPAIPSPFLTSGERRLEWMVELPDADVRGEVRWRGGSRDIVGRGYRDRVWFDLLPWRFPIRRLEWGRAAAGRHAATWVAQHTDAGVVECGWMDGQVTSGRPAGIGLDEPRLLLDGPVVDLRGLRLGAMRPLLRRVTGDPRQTKRAGAATIGGERGRAVSEVVLWG